jgi:uncharacterized membrane protein
VPKKKAYFQARRKNSPPGQNYMGWFLSGLANASFSD